MTSSSSRNLGGLLSHRAQSHGDYPFVHFDGVTTSYAEFDAEVTRVAGGLIKLGVAKLDTIAIALPNGINFLVAWFAVARAGAVEVPIGLENPSPQVAFILADCAAKLLITDAAFIGQHRPIIERGTIEHLVICGTTVADTWPTPVTMLDALNPAAEASGFPEVAPHDPVAIIYTSGTTGDPKGVILCHEHELTLAENIARSVNLQASDCFYNFFPLYHNTGQAIITAAVMTAGARMLLTQRFSKSRFWPDVQEHGCTIFYGMGPILEMLNKDPVGEVASKGHCLRIVWGIAVGIEQAARFRERFGVGLVTGYGSTEANMVAISDAATPEGAAGRVLDDFEVAVVDPEDRLLDFGHVGEIVVRPKRPFVTALGYWRKDRQTVEAWSNLWLHTGDAGTLDEGGILRFVDRIKDVVRHRGNNISSAAVENVILMLDEVEEVAVVPAASELGEFDEEVRAVIVASAGCVIDPWIIAKLCLDHLPKYAVPRFVDVVSELPKTPTGKVRKIEVRKLPASNNRWDRLRSAAAGEPKKTVGETI